MGDKAFTYGSIDMLVLKLIDGEPMYGYQIIEELKRQSCEAFRLSAGSLYPLLHNLERKGYVETFEAQADGKSPGKPRKYYRITGQGERYLLKKAEEWERYSGAINNILYSKRRADS